MHQSVAIHALTKAGVVLANRLGEALGATVFALKRLSDVEAHSFESLPAHVEKVFNQYSSHVFVTAAGIAVRCIAPHLKGKDSDPAVVVMDQEGKFAVSLLSGHLGGANVLAEQCAEIVSGQAVITTATDSAGLPSLDMLAEAKGLGIGNLDRVKIVNGALLDGVKVQVYDPHNCLGVAGDSKFVPVGKRQEWRAGKPGVWVSYRTDCIDGNALRLYPRVLTLGMGCRRGVPETDISAHLRNVFDAAGLALQSVVSLGSVDLKADEAGLLQAAAGMGIEPTFFAKEQLDAVAAPNPSGAVMDRVGVGSVAEASAILLSEGGELIVEKTKTKTVTLAVARRKIC